MGRKNKKGMLQSRISKIDVVYRGKGLKTWKKNK
jgi:hypothetical protein